MDSTLKRKILVLFLLIALKNSSVRADKVNFRDDDEERLMAKLFNSGYNPELRPVVNKSDIVLVTFGMSVHQIHELDEKNQILKASYFVRQTWFNPFLTWSPTEYGGISTINVDARRVWKPDIYLYNNADDMSDGAMDRFNTKIVLEANGSSKWLAPVIISSSCKIDVKHFPFDEQSCGLKFGSWTFANNRLDIVQESVEGDIDKFVTNGEWVLVSFRSSRNEIVYICCPEAYPDVTYTLKIRRLTTFYFINLIIPCFVITAMTLLSFYLPPESGERITLVITNLLALTVFMLLVAEIMPSTSDVVPIVSIYYTCTIFEVALALIATCIVLKIYFKNPALSEMPVWLRHVVLDMLGKLFHIRAHKRKPILANLQVLGFPHDDIEPSHEPPTANGLHETNIIASAKLPATTRAGLKLDNISKEAESLALPHNKNRSKLVKSISQVNLMNGDYHYAPTVDAFCDKPGTLLRIPKRLGRTRSTVSLAHGYLGEQKNLGSRETFLDKSNAALNEDECELKVQEILKCQDRLTQQVSLLLLVAQEQEKEKIKKDEWVLVASIFDYGFMVVFLIMLFLSTFIIFMQSR